VNSPGAAFSQLNGVVATAARHVWAVGHSTKAAENYKTLIEHWNGSSWK
jgi:hypothetical protein